MEFTMSKLQALKNKTQNSANTILDESLTAIIEGDVAYQKNEPCTDIMYVDGLCGSGKTFSLLQEIKANWNKNNKTVIILPTKILASEYEIQLKKLGLEYNQDFYICDSNHTPKKSESTFIQRY